MQFNNITKRATLKTVLTNLLVKVVVNADYRVFAFVRPQIVAQF